MSIIKNCIQKLSKRESLIKIAFVEGNSSRMIAAAAKLKEDNVLEPVLIFETTKQFEEVASKVQGFQKYIIEQELELVEKLAKKYEEKRKGKESFENCLKSLKTCQFFTGMLMHESIIEGAIGGVHLPTADILKAAFKTIGPKDGIKTISSVMVMAKEKETFLFGDISVNPNPSADQLADIAQNSNDFAKAFDIEEKVAFLSFSTSGSASTPQTKKIIEATHNFNKRQCSKYPAIGEVQFDAAFVQVVKDQKYKYDYNFEGTATQFIFPDLNAGNIGYKIAERMGGWSAMGPILAGLKKPYNDLSRGSTIANIIDSAIVTAVQAYALEGDK